METWECGVTDSQREVKRAHRKLREQQLPGPHCLRTFTVPETLRLGSRSRPRFASQAMFNASSEALKRLAQAARFMGTDLPGFPGVLPTWGSQLQYHPHIQSIVPGGDLSKARDAWRPSRANFFGPVKALSPIYRAMYKEAIPKAGRLEPSAPQVWHTPWHGHRQAQPHGLPIPRPLCLQGRHRQPSSWLAQRPHRHRHLSSTEQCTPLHHQPRRHGVSPPVPPACLARGLHESASLWLAARQLCHLYGHSPPDEHAGTSPRFQADSDRTPGTARRLMPHGWCTAARRHAPVAAKQRRA